ncbi:hypothetical protein AB0I39_27850 [Kitasatospora purpeofusca]|uniref:hypothetical protein n=1 Tax=Kitasatospora purpeofusca TaxID=67352 RepID=UPI0033C1DEE9
MDRQMISSVGRRTVLRCLAVGMVATVAAACGKGGGPVSVKEQMLLAFLQGRWAFKAENGTGGVIDVRADGTWQLADSSGGQTSGGWTIEKGRFTATTSRRPPHTIDEVPDKASDALSKNYQLAGGLTDHQDAGYRNMQVRHDKGTVVLTFPDVDTTGTTGGPRGRVVTCTRLDSGPS